MLTAKVGCLPDLYKDMHREVQHGNVVNFDVYLDKVQLSGWGAHRCTKVYTVGQNPEKSQI